jgi:hypothetical protein
MSRPKLNEAIDINLLSLDENEKARLNEIELEELHSNEEEASSEAQQKILSASDRRPYYKATIPGDIFELESNKDLTLYFDKDQNLIEIRVPRTDACAHDLSEGCLKRMDAAVDLLAPHHLSHNTKGISIRSSKNSDKPLASKEYIDALIQKCKDKGVKFNYSCLEGKELPDKNKNVWVYDTTTEAFQLKGNDNLKLVAATEKENHNTMTFGN